MQDSALSYLRHGQTPFFRLPASRDVANADVAVLGIPYDGGTTYQPGARLAPFHVRRVSALLQSHHPVHGIDVFSQLRCVDGGNIVFPPFDRTAMRSEVEREIRQLSAALVAPVVVGGDHSVTLPILRALSKRHGPLAVVQFDAHLDLSTAEVWGEDFHHGTPFRHAIDEGLIADGQLYQLGLRGSRGAASDDALSRAREHTAITADAIAERTPKRVCAELRERIGKRPVYVSFDVDAIDPAFAPGTGTPVPGGITSREALALVRGLVGLDVCGGDVVEVCPPLDHADLTSHLAANLVWELLAVMAMRD
ncbi:MAG: agmatinase [Deltaproteobacteria bacterium]|nr:agmatinase [Deltaproteobacteria bacterium]